ncbi:hypothetical protein KUCAC02_031881, partial [Chaenocephalus aceratus]
GLSDWTSQGGRSSASRNPTATNSETEEEEEEEEERKRRDSEENTLLQEEMECEERTRGRPLDSERNPQRVSCEADAARLRKDASGLQRRGSFPSVLTQQTQEGCFRTPEERILSICADSADSGRMLQDSRGEDPFHL